MYTGDKIWKRGYETISCNILVDATDEGGDEAEQCNCAKPFSGGKCCFDDRCYNFATQTECVDCWPGSSCLAWKGTVLIKAI